MDSFYQSVGSFGRPAEFGGGASLGKIKVVDALRDVGIILLPMLGLLALIIVFPELVLFLPRWLETQMLSP